MDCTVKWSLEAIENLEFITEYIAKDSVFYSRAVVSKVLAPTSKIREPPFNCPGWHQKSEKTLFENTLYSHRVVYRLEDNSTFIVAVIHRKKLLEGISERFEK